MVGYVKHFENNNSKDTIAISSNATDKKQLKNYIKIWEKIITLLNKELDSEPAYMVIMKNI